MQQTLTDMILEQLPEALQSEVISVDFRRSPMGVADAVVAFRRQDDRIGALTRSLVGSPLVASALHKSHELKIRLHDAFVADYCDRIDIDDVSSSSATPSRIRVAFCDPNLNKALHAGHLRNIALGQAIAALWRHQGAAVTTQSVACDIGRNMAEALAGLAHSDCPDVDAFAGRLDRHLGQLYARYVRTGAVDEGKANRADAMIAREIEVHRDEADRILDLWRAADPQTLQTWSRVVDRILHEHAATLARLGVALDTVVVESRALASQAGLIERLTRLGLARVETSGAVVIETGREDYPHCPLVRSDGFPTEHLRALALWSDLARAPFDATIHVMGDEWRTSTEVRIALLDQLDCPGIGDRYTIVGHALVRFGSSTMKSSSGNVLLIDDLLDAIATRVGAADAQRGTPVGERGVRAAALVPLIAAAADQIVDVSEDRFTDLDTNLGWQLARAAAPVGKLPRPDPTDPIARYLVLQVERLQETIGRAARASDPLPVVRFCRHLLELDRRFELSVPAQLWRARLIDRALCALGVVT
jgi:arginyl-tRNA synthetase